MLAGRLLSIAMRLQTRGRMSARELAAEFEVAVRTIHRDIDQLSAAGVPVCADRGRNGGFRLLDGYRTNLTGLTQSEAEALFIAGLPGPAAQLGLADILSDARLKLMAALPPALQPGAERIAGRFHLDVAGWFRGTEQPPSLQTIARAVWGERMLAFRYRRAGEERVGSRRIAPLGLVLKGGVWYLVAQDGESIRTYKAASIDRARVCAQGFTRPGSFNLAAHWARASSAYEAGVYHHLADVKLSPRGVDLLGLLGPFVVDAAARTSRKPDRKGWVRCTVPLESIDGGVRELMRLRNEVNVIGPPALRVRLAETAARLARNHAGLPGRARGNV